MHQFLKLRYVTINTNAITKIISANNRHDIYMEQNLWGMCWFIGGGLATQHNIIEVCEKKHYDDYQIVTNWINNIK